MLHVPRPAASSTQRAAAPAPCLVQGMTAHERKSALVGGGLPALIRSLSGALRRVTGTWRSSSGSTEDASQRRAAAALRARSYRRPAVLLAFPASRARTLLGPSWGRFRWPAKLRGCSMYPAPLPPCPRDRTKAAHRPAERAQQKRECAILGRAGRRQKMPARERAATGLRLWRRDTHPHSCARERSCRRARR